MPEVIELSNKKYIDTTEVLDILPNAISERTLFRKVKSQEIPPNKVRIIKNGKSIKYQFEEEFIRSYVNNYFNLVKNNNRKKNDKNFNSTTLLFFLLILFLIIVLLINYSTSIKIEKQKVKILEIENIMKENKSLSMEKKLYDTSIYLSNSYRNLDSKINITKKLLSSNIESNTDLISILNNEMTNLSNRQKKLELMIIELKKRNNTNQVIKIVKDK